MRSAGNRKRREERGVTLIELMVAITLVAAIATGMLMAARTSLTVLQKVDTRLQSNRRVMSVEQILARELGGVMPVMGDCLESGRAAAFRGNAQTLRLVTSYSIAEGARGYPKLIELQVTPSDRGVRLIVNEHLYAGPSSSLSFCGDTPAQPDPQSFVLADHLAYCRILYKDTRRDTPVSGEWLPFWNKGDLPAAVRVDMMPVDVDASRLPLMPVTVPIHITREVAVPYVDAY
jgi:prepilin-type N-terminal cleavage/methylation domain-containing protein